jgi:prepilin-type processing-associated H-X9-DG protein
LSPITVTLQQILAQWAAKDGAAAVKAALALPEGSRLRQAVYPQVMYAWGLNAPYSASRWYFSPEQSTVRMSTTLVAGLPFARAVTRWAALNDIDNAVNSIAMLNHPSEVWGAAQAINSVGTIMGLSTDKIGQKLASVKVHKDTLLVFNHSQKILEVLGIADDETRLDIGSFVRMSMPGALHPGGVNVIFADGSVRFVKDTINLRTWSSIIDKAGGEVISKDAY